MSNKNMYNQEQAQKENIKNIEAILDILESLPTHSHCLCNDCSKLLDSDDSFVSLNELRESLNSTIQLFKEASV